MNGYIVTQKDIEVLMQSDKTLFYKLELLNEDLKVVDLIEGNLISDNISISADSDIRRTYTCELVVTDSTFVHILEYFIIEVWKSYGIVWEHIYL